MTAEDELLDMDAWTVPDGWIPHRVAPCMGPGCGRMVLWCWTMTGHLTAVDADGRHHWMTCAGILENRRRTKGKP